METENVRETVVFVEKFNIYLKSGCYFFVKGLSLIQKMRYYRKGNYF